MPNLIGSIFLYEVSDNDLEHTVLSLPTIMSTPRPRLKRAMTVVGVPQTLINTSNQELQQNLHVQPALFFYSEETFQEVRCRSIEDIRTVKNNECLWIDVTGVS